jgi:hypothetical protein
MRSLSTLILAAQKTNNYDGWVDLYLWHTADTEGYTSLSHAKEYLRPKILSVYSVESVRDYHTRIVLDNSDKFFSTREWKGYNFVLDWGVKQVTTKYMETFIPLTVTSQQNISQAGRLVTVMDAVGLPNLLSMDKSWGFYIGAAGDGKTIKDLITSLCAASIYSTDDITSPLFGNEYTLNIASEDALIDTFCPEDSFFIQSGESLLDIICRLLSFTKCVLRVSSDNEVYIFNPTISGTTYDYQYKLVDGYHKFYDKDTKDKLVIPNRITVKNMNDASDPDYHFGTAVSSESNAKLPKTELYLLPSITSDADCSDIAEALMHHAELDSDTGYAFVPMNFGQEVWDYVKVTDSRAGDSKTGNIQYIIRTYNPQETPSMKMYIHYGNAAGMLSTNFASLASQDDTVSTGQLKDTMLKMYSEFLKLQEQVNNLTAQLGPGGSYRIPSISDFGTNGHINSGMTATDLTLVNLFGTTYQNDSGKNRIVSVCFELKVGYYAGYGNINGDSWVVAQCDATSTPSEIVGMEELQLIVPGGGSNYIQNMRQIIFPVPPGYNYKLTANSLYGGVLPEIFTWWEYDEN